MVITRSQSKLLSKKIVYRGFCLYDDKYVVNIDNFYNELEQFSNQKSLLKNFWIANKPSIIIPEIPIEMRQKFLLNLVNNKSMWDKFTKTINEIIVPYQKYLEQDIYQQKLIAGEIVLKIDVGNRKFVSLNLTPLLEFNFWLAYLTSLFCNIQSELLSLVLKTNNSIDKSKIVKTIFEINIACKEFISNRYAFNSMKYYVVNINKMIDFIKNEGLEVAFYTFGVFFPNMITDNYFPNVNKSTKFYQHNELEIKDDDPIFGEIKKKCKVIYY
jgi:hypothetical protein